jgi:hypothetical protein
VAAGGFGFAAGAAACANVRLAVDTSAINTPENNRANDARFMLPPLRKRPENLRRYRAGGRGS